MRLGRAICLGLARAGYDIVIHCRESRSAAEALRAEIERLGVRAWVMEADLDDEGACRSLVSRVREMVGGIDLLVNNAAVFHRDRIDSLDVGRFLEGLRINVLAPLYLVQEFAANCEGTGAVVNILDSRVALGDAAAVGYTAGKKLLAEWTRIAAVEWAPRIRVNAVAPGAVLPPSGDVSERAGRQMLDRRVTAEDVAEAVVYLAGAQSVTGQILYADGGQHLAGIRDDSGSQMPRL